MEKRQLRILFPAFPDLCGISLSRHSLAGNARRSRTAGARRPSERGGVISPEPAFSTDASQPHVFSCHMKLFPDKHTHANIVSQYTLR